MKYEALEVFSLAPGTRVQAWDILIVLIKVREPRNDARHTKEAISQRLCACHLCLPETASDGNKGVTIIVC